MKLSQNLNDALNQQILIEYGNELKYAQIQSYFEDWQLKNIAKYFQSQAAGENDHANLFLNYINDRTGGKVTLGEVDAPKPEFSDIASVGEYFVKIEEDTTASIEELYDLALSEKSYIDLPFLSEMLREQCEEEDSANKWAMNLKMVKDLVIFDATLK